MSLLNFRTTEEKQCLDITDAIRNAVRDSKVRQGLCHVMALHATAAIVINENADPNICTDLLNAVEKSFPDHAGWLHDRVDNNAGAHIKAAVLGPSETVPIENGQLVLGTWQSIMLVEFDGPKRERRVKVTFIS